jgi:hypothetical protein
MSVATLATFGGTTLSLGYAGQIANQEECSIFSLTNGSTTGGDDSAGMLDFGLAVARHATAGYCKRIAADADLPIGITVRHPTMVTSAAGAVGYRATDEVAIMYLGDIYCIAYENVTAGDSVLSVTAQGGKLSGPTSGVAGSGRVAIPNAHWVTTTSAGQIGLVRLTGVSNPKTTT